MKKKLNKLNKSFIYFFLIIFLILIFSVHIFSQKSLKDFFYVSTDTNPQILKCNIKNTNSNFIVIDTFNNAFSISANIDTNFYSLVPHTLDYSSNKFCKDNLNLFLKDLNNDHIKEIFTQGYVNGTSIQHIFSLKDDDFSDIWCSNNNIMGCYSDTYSKDVKILSGNFKNNKLFWDSFLFTNEKLSKLCHFENSNYFGENIVCDLISNIQDLNTNQVIKDDYNKFHSMLEELSSENTKYLFSNALLYKCESDYIYPSKTNWILNFSSLNYSCPSLSNNLIIKINLTLKDYNWYLKDYTLTFN